jgi:enoyl-CoA hydratase/carnithine racemase
MSEPILCEIDGGIATLTLNRPEKLNAISYAMADSLLAALDALEADAGVRAIILTGAGDRAFSAGADIAEFSQSLRLGADAAVRDFVRRGQAMTSRLEAFGKPVIAAVNGLAFGGGCEVTQAAHLAVASEQAVFGEPEIHLGMLPTFGGSQRLPRLAGRKARTRAAADRRDLRAGQGTGDRPGQQGRAPPGPFARLAPTHDLHEGLTAWMERRPATYAGR